MQKLTECKSIDCGGTENDHGTHCEYMTTEFGLEDRDMNEKPYTPDEQRAVDYIQRITDGAVGAGSDPIGFLIASHNYISLERGEQASELETLRSMQEDFHYLYKWVERGLFCPKTSMGEALQCIAHHPSAPWKNGRWDVDHKTYAKEFYEKFPKAKGNDAP